MTLPGILKHIFTPESRKVGFGWALFITATWLLAGPSKITSNEWQTAVLLSSALIGGGTLLDKYLANQKQAINNPNPPTP